MTKPVTIPNTFATATTAIPLSNLDADFSTVATAMNDANTYSNYAPDTGSANAYVVTLTGVSTTYSAGLRIQFKAGNANTTASTLNVNAQGAKNITYQDASAIASGTIAANSIVDVMYDGTQFLLMNDPAGATGGDVTGPASATDNAVVRFDGTTGKLVQNSVVTIADSTGDISGVGQLNATTVDTTNIEVTNIKAKDGTAAATIADATGVVSITANPVLSGGTANGVLYLNGSKVATSGSDVVYTGNFGIGTSSPTYKLNVVSGAGVQNIFQAAQSGVSNGYTVTSDGTNLTYQWFTSGSEQMRLTSTGLGIGTSSPGTKLDVAGAARSESWIGRSNTSAPTADAFIYRPADNTLGFGTANTLRLTLDSSGNLGLGVTPSAWSSFWKVSQVVRSHFADYNSGEYLSMGHNAYESSGWKYIGTGNATLYQQSIGQHIWLTAPSGTAGNAITFTQAMTLDASGNLGVGETNPGCRLHAKGSNLQLRLQSSGVDDTTEINFYNGSNNQARIDSRNDGITTNTGILRFYTQPASGSATERARITSDGNFSIGGSANRATTVGTAALNIFNGTAPVGTLTNGISIYSSSGEAYVMDAAGNATLFSPHDAETNEWIFKSKHTPTGKVLKIDVEKLLRFVNDHFGLDAVHEFIES
jgi:hypothetical protein